MKKFIVLAVSLMVLGFAASSFAMQAEIPADTTAAIAKGGTQVTIGGELRFRGATYQNSDFNRNVANGQGGWPEGQVYESRVRLSVEAKMSPNTIGFIQMEAAGGGDNFGENTNWGSEGCKGLGGTFKCGDVKSNEFRVLQAWIQHSGSGLFGVPAYIKVGHQPVVIGAGVFYRHNLDNDDAIIAGITPIKGLDLTAVTVKLYEGLQNSSDDATLYSGMVTYAITKDIVVGADLSYLDMQPNSMSPASTVGPFHAHLWNIGFNAKAKVAGFSLKGSADFQSGDDGYPASAITFYYRGFAFTLGAAYTFEPVTLGLDLGYGSGDSNRDFKMNTFKTSQSHTPMFPGTFVYEYLTVNAAGNLGGGLENTMYLKLSAAGDVMRDLNVGGSLTLLNAANKAFGGGGPDSLAGFPVSSRYIGTEVDINASYQIDKGLKLFVEGGYLFAGNFWKGATGMSKVSDPWGIRHGIQLNF